MVGLITRCPDWMMCWHKMMQQSTRRVMSLALKGFSSAAGIPFDTLLYQKRGRGKVDTWYVVMTKQLSQCSKKSIND